MRNQSLPLYTTLLSSICLMFSHCTQKSESTDFSGFWVSTNYDRDIPFHTMIVEDSVVETNRYGVHNYIYPLWPKEDYFEAHYPFDSWETAFLLFKEGDTLLQVYQLAEGDTIKFIRKDSSNLAVEPFFDFRLRIDLPDASDSLITLEPKVFMSNLYIGSLKSGVTGQYPGMRTDSLLLQVHDVFIDISEIEDFLKTEQSMLDESDREKLIILVHADKGVPQEMIGRIRNEVYQFNANLAVYRSCIDRDTRKFFYKAI